MDECELQVRWVVTSYSVYFPVMRLVSWHELSSTLKTCPLARNLLLDSLLFSALEIRLGSRCCSQSASGALSSASGPLFSLKSTLLPDSLVSPTQSQSRWTCPIPTSDVNSRSVHYDFSGAIAWRPLVGSLQVQHQAGPITL